MSLGNFLHLKNKDNNIPLKNIMRTSKIIFIKNLIFC